VKDAVVRTSFRCVFAVALNLAADYELAAVVAHEMIADADEHRLEFTMPYGYAALASAYAGLHSYREAHEMIDRAVASSLRISNFHAEDNARALQLRILSQQGHSDEACAIELRSPRTRLRSLRGEILTSRALALSCSGRLDEASEHVLAVEGTTGAIETRVLSPAVRAIVAIRSGKRDVRGSVERLVAEALASGGVDLLATSYRASSDLLSVLLSANTTRADVWKVINRTQDAELATAAGFLPPQRADPRSTLSKREREIYELICQGLSNKQIAGCLFISEATVKVHVQHIFDKLGTRSRTALALSAARERSLQAAPAAQDGSSDELTSTVLDTSS
jgi:DNA-binding CsgD family transcriptional regulator